MPSQKRTSIGPIGCDVSDDEVRMMQFRLGAIDPSLIVAAVRDIPNGNSRGECTSLAVREAVTAAGITQGGVVSCLGADDVEYRSISMAPMPADELAAAVHFRCAKELQWGINDFISDYHDSELTGQAGALRRTVIAAAAATSAVTEHASLLRAAGCLPLAIDTRAGALARCLGCSWRPDALRLPVLLIDVGRGRSCILLVHGGSPWMVRPIAVGSGGESDRPDTPPVSMTAMTREIAHEAALCLHHFAETWSNQSEPEYGCLIGGGQNQDAMRAALTKRVGIEFLSLTDRLEPKVDSTLPALVRAEGLDAWAVSFGLALYGHEHALKEFAA